MAIVDNNGMVTGISAGTTKVIADLGNDVSVECLITINASVFTVGSITDQGTEVATLWINGEANAISDGITDAVANDVFVHGQDIYVVGYKDDPNNESYTIAMLWKNGVSTELSDPGEETRAQATSIQVNGNDVYVGGYNFDVNTERYGGYLWLNGEKVVDAPQFYHCAIMKEKAFMFLEVTMRRITQLQQPLLVNSILKLLLI